MTKRVNRDPLEVHFPMDRRRFLKAAAGTAALGTLLAARDRVARVFTPAGLLVPAAIIPAHPGGLVAAIKKAKPGDTVLCDAGARYSENVQLAPPKGTLANPILIDLNTAELAGLFYLTEPTYIAVRGGKFTNQTTSHQCKMTGGLGWTWTQNEHPSARALSQLLIARGALGARDFNVSYCAFHDNIGTQANLDHHIYCSSGTAADGAEGNGLIERNLGWHNTSGAAFKLGGGSCNIGGAANVEVRYNTLYDCGEVLTTTSWQSEKNNIHHNIAVLSAKKGAGAYHAHQIRTTSNNQAHDNIAYLTDKPTPLTAVTTPGTCGYGGGTLVDGGGNLYIDPLFDKVNALDGFHPLEPLAQNAGRWAA